MIELHDNRKYELDDRLCYLKGTSVRPGGLNKYNYGTNRHICRLFIKSKVRLTMSVSAVFKVNDYD